MPEPETFTFSSPQGYELVDTILAANPARGIIPHSFQREGICASLDGKDILATMATGAGKSGLYSFLMIVIKAISEDPKLCPAVSFPKNPAMVLILPTKALQEDMRRGMSKLGLDVTVLNADTCAEAASLGKDLWTECQTKHNIILISPELLTSRKFERLLNNEEFMSRVCRLGCDEAHLIYSWGRHFHPEFRQLGNIRVRLPVFNQKFIPLVATSATIREGAPKATILKTLALKEGDYHFIRRSNLHPDIQIILRPMKSSLTSYSFPELDWVIDGGENTVIFCKTIATGFRVAAYLSRLAVKKGMENAGEKIRLFNSLNWPSYNNDTLRFLNNNPKSTITIATDTLSVGWDSQYTRDAIVLGEPEDLDEFLQKIGWIGRNRELVKNPRAFLYYTRKAMDHAAEILRSPISAIPQPLSAHLEPGMRGKPTVTMDRSAAEFLLALCYTEDINHQYQNPTSDEQCTCIRCAGIPQVHHGTCRCSRCLPEEPGVEAPKEKRTRAKRGEGISPEMRELATKRFHDLRAVFFRQASKPKSFMSPSTYLPSNAIDALISAIYSIHSPADVKKTILVTRLDDQHFQSISDVCGELKIAFEEIREAKRNKRKAATAAKKAAELQEGTVSSGPIPLEVIMYEREEEEESSDEGDK